MVIIMVTIKLEKPIIMGNFDESDVDKFTVDEWHTFMELLKKLTDATLSLTRSVCITENE